MITSYLSARGDVWQYRWRVPREFAHVEPRGWITKTTRIKVHADPKGIRAAAKAEEIHTEAQRFLANATASTIIADRARFDDAVSRVTSRGLQFIELNTLAQDSNVLPLQQHLAAVSKEVGHGMADPSKAQAYAREVAAVLGDVKPVTILVSQMRATIEQANIIRKSPGQKIKRSDALDLVVENFIKVVGDRDLTALTREDVLAFRQWFVDRIKKGELSYKTANKNLYLLAGMYNAIANLNSQWKLSLLLFAKIRIPKDGQGRGRVRESYSTEFVQTKLLADGALDGLNTEARRSWLAMFETGMRPCEAVNLRREHIHTSNNLPFPYLEIAAVDDRERKTENSIRKIPLVGVSLAAIEAALADLPPGEDRLFPRYYDKSDTMWSNDVNTFLTDNNLREPRCSAYSMRHSFKTRCRTYMIDDRGFDEESKGVKDIINLNMGHAESAEGYGGIELPEKRRWALAIMFKSWPKNL